MMLFGSFFCVFIHKKNRPFRIGFIKTHCYIAKYYKLIDPRLTGRPLDTITPVMVTGKYGAAGVMVTS